MSKKIRAIILAAGRGSRMKNLTSEIPKCLTKIKGKSLLEMQITNFKKAGISDIAIVTGYKNHLLQVYGLKEFYNRYWKETNMVFSLECANNWLENFTCIVSYSDIFYKKSAIELLKSDNNKISITYDPKWLSLWNKRFERPIDDAETFKIDGNFQLLEIGYKPKNLNEIQGQYMGLLKFEPTGWLEFKQMWNEINKINKNISMTEMLQEIILKNNLKINCLSYLEEWGEVDLESDLRLYNKFL